jgi:hypothetical protein
MVRVTGQVKLVAFLIAGAVVPALLLAMLLAIQRKDDRLLKVEQSHFAKCLKAGQECDLSASLWLQPFDFRVLLTRSRSSTLLQLGSSAANDCGVSNAFPNRSHGGFSGHILNVRARPAFRGGYNRVHVLLGERMGNLLEQAHDDLLAVFGCWWSYMKLDPESSQKGWVAIFGAVRGSYDEDLRRRFGQCLLVVVVVVKVVRIVSTTRRSSAVMTVRDQSELCEQFCKDSSRASVAFAALSRAFATRLADGIDLVKEDDGTSRRLLIGTLRCFGKYVANGSL